jgi:Na+/proline symporter
MFPDLAYCSHVNGLFRIIILADVGIEVVIGLNHWFRAIAGANPAFATIRPFQSIHPCNHRALGWLLLFEGTGHLSPHLVAYDTRDVPSSRNGARKRHWTRTSTQNK